MKYFVPQNRPTTLETTWILSETYPSLKVPNTIFPVVHISFPWAQPIYFISKSLRRILLFILWFSLKTYCSCFQDLEAFLRQCIVWRDVIVLRIHIHSQWECGLLFCLAWEIKFLKRPRDLVSSRKKLILCPCSLISYMFPCTEILWYFFSTLLYCSRIDSNSRKGTWRVSLPPFPFFSFSSQH